MTFETAFTMETSSVKYGAGATREVGWDVKRAGRDAGHGRHRPVPERQPAGARSRSKSLRDEGLDAVLYDRARVEPTDVSFKEAIDFAADGGFDAYVAVGGGSVMDTAKAANLYATWPADFMAYVNPPIGRGEPVPGPLKPLVADPDHGRHGQRVLGHHGLRPRGDARQDGHPPAHGAADAGDRGHARARGRCRRW